MQQPIFSIVTVTFNNLFGLQQTAKSLMRQTSYDYEWLVIDGHSNDGTQKYLDTLKANYISEPDDGIYDAMNKGIKHAKGKYILFLNAGDCLESKNTLSEISGRLNEQKFDLIYGDSVEDLNGKKLFKRAKPHNEIEKGMFTHHQAMIYNASLLKDIKYDLQYDISADYNLTWDVILQSKDFLYLPFPLCIFEAGGISQQKVLQGRKEQFLIRRKNKVPLIKNLMIFAGQTINYQIRKYMPKLYWWLKRA